MAHQPGSLEATREATERWAAHDLSTKKELHAAVLGIIQKATSIEQVEAIGLAIAEAILVSNLRLYRQLENGNWTLRNPRM